MDSKFPGRVFFSFSAIILGIELNLVLAERNLLK